MKILDYPEKRQEVLNYVRRTGKVSGAGKVANCSDQNIYDYGSEHPEFKARVELAKKNFKDGEFDDLQRLWNRNAKEYNSATIDAIFEVLLYGERVLDETVFEEPLKNEDGSVMEDEHGNPVLELKRKVTRTYRKPVPEWVIKLALELMKGHHGEPEILKIAPTVVLQFVQYLKAEVELDGESMQAIIGKAQDFDKVLKENVLAIQGKVSR